MMPCARRTRGCTAGHRVAARRRWLPARVAPTARMAVRRLCAQARRGGAAPWPRRRRGRRAGTRGARRRAARPPARARRTRARRAGSRAWPARRPRAPAGPARRRRELAVCVWVWGPACRVGARARSGIRPAHLACLTPASPLHLRTTQRSSAPAAKHATCFAEEAQRARCHLHGPLTLSSSVAF